MVGGSDVADNTQLKCHLFMKCYKNLPGFSKSTLKDKLKYVPSLYKICYWSNHSKNINTSQHSLALEWYMMDNNGCVMKYGGLAYTLHERKVLLCRIIYYLITYYDYLMDLHLLELKSLYKAVTIDNNLHIYHHP